MFQIGTVKIESPVVLAALSGYSDWAMRSLARSMGAPYTVHEVMIESFVNNLKDRDKTRRHLMVTDDDHPAGAQLMGSEPDEFAHAAVRLVNAGFDIIDINFGCPMKRQRGKCRGGLHLGQPELAIEILQRVRDVVPPSVPVTVKMLRGIDDSPRSRDQFFRILEAAFARGISAATIHGRTVQQKYVGPSQWDFLKQVRQQFPNNTLLGSGDLFTASDCLRMLKETGVDGVTAARGAIGNPWIFQQFNALMNGEDLPDAPTVHQQRAVILDHFRRAEIIYPDSSAVRQLRKFCLRYAFWHPMAATVRDAFIQVRNATDWHRVLQNYFSVDASGQYPVLADESQTEPAAESASLHEPA